MFNIRKFRFSWCGWGKIKCEHCGYRFEADDNIIKLSLSNNIKYVHDFCRDEMDAEETMNMFGIEMEEVAV